MTMDISIEGIARRMCREIAEDIDVYGTVPDTVRSFGELHDYVDANMYADQWCTVRERVTGETWLDYINHVTDIVDAWLQSGRPDKVLT